MDHRHRILIVDDEAPNRELLAAMVEALGHDSEVAADGLEALARLPGGFDLVLLDVMMPGMSGFEVVRRIRAHSDHRDLPIVMVTALNSKDDRLRAVEAGANDFITKPVDRTELAVRTASLLKVKQAQDALKQYQAELEAAVATRTADLLHALEELAAAQRTTYEAHLDTVHRLALAAEFKDSYTAGHIYRVSEYCALLGELLNLSPRDIELLHHASTMHDVGKLAMPDAILLKAGKLTDEEWHTIRQHTTFGAKLLSGSSSEMLEAGRVIALTHHEKWDGSGYPEGLAGEAIPLFGRICALADAFDMLTHDRPDRPAFSNEQAFEVLRSERGVQFDPELTDLFFANLPRVLAIQAAWPETRSEGEAESGSESPGLDLSAA